jgi:hypothetical protein
MVVGATRQPQVTVRILVLLNFGLISKDSIVSLSRGHREFRLEVRQQAEDEEIRHNLQVEFRQ